LRSFQSASLIPVTGGASGSIAGWVSPALTVINHLFIGSSEGMMANIAICHRDRNPNNPAYLFVITPLDFMAGAEQDFPSSEIIFHENATS
jgi:hypothetical protein